MEIVTVSIIVGGTVLFFIGTQIVGLCSRSVKGSLGKRRRGTFYGTSDTIYNGL
jgi:hypothetical protein